MRYAISHPDGHYIILLLCLGIRGGELCALRWEDIDLDERVVRVNKSVTKVDNLPVVDVPKTESSIRVLPISRSFAKYLSQFSNRKGYIVTDQEGNIMLPEKFQRNRYKKFMAGYIQSLGEGAETEILNPHELRHTCGTLLYQRTKNIYAISKFLGHSNIGITASIYVHDNLDMLRDGLGIK